MSTGTIVVVHENKQIPEKFLDILLDKHKTSVGYAVKNSYGVVEMENLSEFDLKTTVREIERTYNGNTICFHFSNEQEPAEDDTQPFPIIIEGEDVKLCVLLEGEFPGYAEVDDDHTNEYCAVDQYLKETLVDLYEENGKDLEKMLQAADEAKFRKNLLNLLRPRGYILLVPGVGEVTSFAMDPDVGSYEWGVASKSFGYTEIVEKPKEEEKPVTKTGGLRDKLKLKQQETPFTDKPSEAKTSVPPVPLKQEDHIFCEASVQGKARRRWIRKNFGLTDDKFPGGWEGNYAWPVSSLLPNSALKAGLKAKQEEVKKDETPSVITEVPPIMPPGARKDFAEMLKLPGIIEAEDAIKSQEGKFPSFCEQNQTTIEKIARLSFRTYRKIGSDLGIQSLACVANDLRHELIKRCPDILRPEAKPPEAEPEKVTEPAKTGGLRDRLARKM